MDGLDGHHGAMVLNVHAALVSGVGTDCRGARWTVPIHMMGGLPSQQYSMIDSTVKLAKF